MKLYPPIIESILPAQYIPQGSSLTFNLVIPFQLNRAVSWADLGENKRMALIIKNISAGTPIVENVIGSVITMVTKYQSPAANFQIRKEDFEPTSGQYYKIQLAFLDDEGNIGYYSDVGVVKFTQQPDLYIENLTSGTNIVQYSYTGIYENNDISEKVYSYEFNIYDSDTGLLHDSSGECLHNSSADTERNKSSDTWTSYKTLKEDRVYYINYKVKTINGIESESSSYAIMAMDTLDLVSRNSEFIATLNYDNAYVHVHILPKDKDAPIKAVTGNFILVRASSEDNFQSWHEIYKFTLVNNYPLMTIWKDFTVQQGHSYKYAVQAYNSKGVFSNRLECKYYLSEKDELADDINRQNWDSELNRSYAEWNYLITGEGLPVDFEDAFLFDGERQLRIRYNPKISSFKSTLLETKMETIGGKYPFIFRNGNVEYKEFPISGLLSILSDEEGLFVESNKEEAVLRQYTLNGPYDPDNQYNLSPVGYVQYADAYALNEEREKHIQEGTPTALTAYNFRREREFKLEVLKWLTNGQPKLFRSPGEGNFIVRLMNVSLTPNDTVGRMLHTFNCTAYEVANYDFENLEKYNFINALTMSYQELKFRMVDAFTTFRNGGYDKQIVIDNGAYYFAVIDQFGYWALRVTYANGNVRTFNCGNPTGQFLLDKDSLKSNPIVSIESIEGTPDLEAKILYGYYQEVDIAFSLISEITRETLVTQIIGHPEFTDTSGNYRENSFNLNHILALTEGYTQAQAGEYGESIDDIPRLILGKFYYIKAEPRAYISIYYSGGKYYVNTALLDEVVAWDDTAMYKVYKKSGNDWVLDQTYSGRPENGIRMGQPSYLIGYNAIENNGAGPAVEQLVDLSLRGGAGINSPITTGRYEMYFDLDKLTSLRVGSGVVCEICYNLSTVLYECEEQTEAYTQLAAKKRAWINAKTAYENTLDAGISQFHGTSETLRKDMDRKYKSYLEKLKSTIEEIEERQDTYYAL